MLNSKTERYPWKCFCCEGIFESNNEPSVIWVTPLPEAMVMFACKACEDQTYIEDIVCQGCFEIYTAVYHNEHEKVICNCGHAHVFQDDDDCGDCNDCDGCNG
jgi:hypothetical protein